MLVLVVLAGAPLIVSEAWAQTCIELANCAFTNPFDMASYAYEVLMGDWIYPLVWGAFVGTIYIFGKNGMLAGITGVIIASFFISGNVWQNSATSQAFYWGYVLLAISAGGTLFYMVWYRTRNP